MIAEAHFAATTTKHSGGSWVFILVAACIFCIAIALVINPKLQWRMNRWQFKNPQAMEPSKAGLIGIRVGAAVAAVVAVVFVVIGTTRL